MWCTLHGYIPHCGVWGSEGKCGKFMPNAISKAGVEYYFRCGDLEVNRKGVKVKLLLW